MKMSFGASGLTGEEGLRGQERGMDPGFSQRQLRVPGAMRPHISTGMKPPRMGGLGSLHHTMPHLRRFSGTPHYQGGGLSSNPVGQMMRSGQNLSGDAQYRNFLQLIGQTPFTNRSLMQQPSPVVQFGYQRGGAAQPDPEEVESPDDEMSPDEQQEKQIVLNAMAALDGESPDPERDLAAFIDAFGPHALADLQQLVESKHMEAQGSGEEEEDEGEEIPGGGSRGEPGDDEDQEEEAAHDLQAAGGGLLDGRGTGQSDEIEATTPSGHPVLLSDGEYVIDAPTVAALGDGSTKAGARRLDEMRKQIRRSAYGHDKQAKPMKASGGGVVIKLK